MAPRIRQKLNWIICTLVLLFLLVYQSAPIHAIYDPGSVPNNRTGIHILDPEEIVQASKLVNRNGGDWGYVTIPIQSVDRNLEKWSKFMKESRDLHIVPIVRLATYPVGDNWVRPTQDDVLDFVNFLDTLSWPTQNRYVVLFNEPNHASEWGGQVSPEEYTLILDFAVKAFKDKSPDFFVLPAGLDAAAPNASGSLSSRLFLNRMAQTNVEIFSQIDGWTSHSYPNPDFAGQPTNRNFDSVIGFIYELQIIKKWTTKTLPVFITETGWQHKDIPLQTVANFLMYAFGSVWKDDRVIAVTPFVLSAFDGPFEKFSFLQKGEPTPLSESLKFMAKNKGSPLLATPSGVTTPSTVSTPASSQEPIGPLLEMVKSWLKI